MNSKSIKTKLFLLLALMGAIPFLAAVIFIGYRNVIHMDGHAKEESWTKNVTINSDLTQELDKNLYVLHTLALSPSIKRYLADPNPQNEAIVHDIIQSTNSLFQDDNLLAIVDTHGLQLLRTDNSPRVNISQRKNFKEVMNGKDYVSDIMISMSTGSLMVAIATPVFDNNHRVIGMVERNFYLDVLQNFIQTQNNEHTSIYILDRENKVVAHSEGDKSTEEVDLSDELMLIKKALNGHQGTAHVDEEGTNILATYSVNQLSGWSIVTLMPYRQIWLTVNDAIARGLVLGFVVMLFVNMAAHLLATRITRPLREITDAITKIASGQTDIEKLQVTSNDELGEMAKAVNEMTAMRGNASSTVIHDFLTGLYTREAMENLCRRKLMEYNEAAVSPGMVSIILIDLDHFKKASRDEGHEYGNYILKDFANRLESFFQNSACLGRLEGDEFMIILDNQKDLDSIKRNAAQVNKIARDITVNGQNAGLSASIGVAVAPVDGKTYNHLFHAADLALFQAKDQGRDCYHLASDSE